MLFEKSKLRPAPLRPDTAANPQAGDVHEAATEEGSAGTIYHLFCALKQKEVRQYLIVNIKT